MDTLLTQNQFIKMRDQGKFSTKFLGKHSYFVYLERPKCKNKNLEIYIKDEEPQDIGKIVLLINI